MKPNTVSEFTLQFSQGGKQNLPDQCCFSTSAYSANHTKYVQRKFNGNVLQVVLAGTLYFNGSVPFPYSCLGFNFQSAAQVFTSQALAIINYIIIISIGYYLTPQVRCQGPHIYNVIGFSHHHFIMLDYYYCIAQIP